jgi:hypothetical protein
VTALKQLQIYAVLVNRSIIWIEERIGFSGFCSKNISAYNFYFIVIVRIEVLKDKYLLNKFKYSKTIV